VIDTGIHVGHLDLDGGKVIAFKDFVNGRTAPYDDDGHGTARTSRRRSPGTATPAQIASTAASRPGRGSSA
jgi:serine protease AprX